MKYEVITLIEGGALPIQENIFLYFDNMYK